MRQDTFPRGHTIPTGAVPGLVRGLGYTAPTYLRRRPGSPSNGLRGPALLFRIDRLEMNHAVSRKSALREEALRRRGALGPEIRAMFSARLAEQGLAIARRVGARIASAFLADQR